MEALIAFVLAIGSNTLGSLLKEIITGELKFKLFKQKNREEKGNKQLSQEKQYSSQKEEFPQKNNTKEINKNTLDQDSTVFSKTEPDQNLINFFESITGLTEPFFPGVSQNTEEGKNAIPVPETKTFTRLTLLKKQFRLLLDRTVDIYQQFDKLEKVKKEIENQWIKEIHIYAFGTDNLCRCQLRLEVDWNEYAYQLSCSKTTISIDDKWIDDTAIELDEFIKGFKEFVVEKSLTTDWAVVYTPSVYADDEQLKKVRHELGLQPRASKVQWVEETPLSLTKKIPEIPELGISIFLVDD